MDQLQNISKETGYAAEFECKVVYAGSLRLALPAGNNRSMRCPDVNFHHSSVRKPAAIIENA